MKCYSMKHLYFIIVNKQKEQHMFIIDTTLKINKLFDVKSYFITVIMVDHHRQMDRTPHVAKQPYGSPWGGGWCCSIYIVIIEAINPQEDVKRRKRKHNKLDGVLGSMHIFFYYRKLAIYMLLYMFHVWSTCIFLEYFMLIRKEHTLK